VATEDNDTPPAALAAAAARMYAAGEAMAEVMAAMHASMAGAYTRPLLSSTSAVSDTQHIH